MSSAPSRRAILAGLTAVAGASTASLALEGAPSDQAYRPFGPWLKRPDDWSGLYNLAWAADAGFPVPLNGIDDDSVGIQKIIDKFGCRLFNPGRYVNIKTQGLVYEGGGAVIMGANPEFSIFARNIALQTLESVTIPYPVSGPVTSTRGVAAIRLGSRTDQAKSAGRGLVQGIRWEHPGRLVGALVGNETLAGQLSHSEAMLEVWGGAGFAVEDCQQGGAVYTYAFYGGDSKRMLRCRSLAQIWDRRNPRMQEGQAAVLLAHGGTAHGAGTSFWADSCTLYGGATTVPQTYTVQEDLTQASAVAPSASNVAVTTTRRAGPLCIFEIQSQEDFQILDCFSSAADRYNIKIAAVRPDDILLNGSIMGGDHDESNEANIATFCQGANFASLRRMTIANTRLNGQLIGKRALDINGDHGFTSVAFLQIINILTTAHLGGAVRISGADGGFLRSSMICGYNTAGNDITAPSKGRLSDVCGIDIVGQTRNFRTEGVTFVGGVNDTTTSGKAQIGYLDETAGRNNTYTGLKSVGLKAGGRSVWSGTKFVEDTAP